MWWFTSPTSLFFFFRKPCSVQPNLTFINKFYFFQLRNTAARQCVDSPAKQDDLHKAVGLWPCHLQGGNQVWNHWRHLLKEFQVCRKLSPNWEFKLYYFAVCLNINIIKSKLGGKQWLSTLKVLKSGEWSLDWISLDIFSWSKFSVNLGVWLKFF